MEKQATDPNVIKLNNVRLSYPQLFVAKEPEKGKKPVFSASFLLNKKEHKALIDLIEKTTERVALDAFKKKVTLKRRPLRDGNEKDDKEGYGDEVMFVGARNEKRPVVVDRDLTPLTAEDTKPYAGCYVNATIRLFAYDHSTGGKGVSASLRAVQFVKDGESFGAGPVDAEQEFEKVGDDVDGYQAMLDDQSPMPFGKYKGRKMEDVPASYLLWLRDEGHTGPVREYIEENIEALLKECPDYIK